MVQCELPDSPNVGNKQGAERALYETLYFNPRRACAARVTVLSLCVCLIHDYSRTTGYEAVYERYQQLLCYKGKKKNAAILLKRQRSGDMARKQAKSQYA